MIEYGLHAISRKIISADIVLHLRYDNEFAKKSNAKYFTLLLKWTGGQIQKAYD